MEVQETIAYFILAGATLYVVLKIAKTFLSKKPASSCASGGCSGCDVKNNCGVPRQ